MSLSLYSSRQEEKLFIRRQARTWKRSGLIDDDQLREIVDHTDPNLRLTNLFFRMIFFIFACICASTLLGLFVWLTGMKGESAFAWTFIIAGMLFYVLAEYGVTEYRLYRHGIEEALAVSAMVLICSGLYIGVNNLFISGRFTPIHAIFLCLVFAISAGWIHLRFGYLYSAIISLIALCIIPFQMSLTPAGERGLLLLVLCLIVFMSTSFDKPDIEDSRKERNTLIQACLLVGVYFTVNLHILRLAGSTINDAGIIPLHPLVFAFPRNLKSFPSYVYWSSYVLTFLIPAIGITWGIRSRKRLIINGNLIFACLTLVTSKSYLGLEHYAWDPAILGIMLVIISIVMSRWLRSGPDGNRSGFTEKDILKPGTHGIKLADVAAALTPGFTDTRQPQAQSEAYFHEGKSGGGGASRDF